MNIKKGIMYVLIANVINLAISLITGFILPKYLSVDTYAYIKLFQLYITYIGICHLGYSDGMYLRVGGKSIDTIDKKEALEEFKLFRVFQIIVSVVLCLVSIVIKNEMLLFCSIVLVPINVSNYIRSLYTAIGQFKKYSRYTNINTFFIFLINVFFLFIIKTDSYYAYIIGQIVVYFFYYLFIEHEIRKIFGHTKVGLNKTYFSNIKVGFPLLIGNFCNVVFTSIDRVFVKNLIGLAQFAYYSFAVSIENLLNVFITPISVVMYNYFCGNKTKDSVIKLKKIICVFSSLLVVFFFPVKFVVNNWLTKYEDAIFVLLILLSAQYISIMVRTIHINLYKAEKKQNRYFNIMIIIVVLSVILNLIGYYYYKSMDAIAIATLATNIIWYIIGEIDFKRFHLGLKDYIYTLLSMVLFILCGIYFNSIIGGIVYLTTIVALSFILENECIKYFKEGILNVVINKMKGMKNEK